MAIFNSGNNSLQTHNKTLFEVVMVADQFGNPIFSGNPSGMAVDGFGRARMSTPYTLFDSFNRFKINNDFVSSNTSGGSISFNTNESSVLLEVNTTNGAQVIRETKKVFAYQPGKSLQILNTFVLHPPQTNLRQRIGYYGEENGIYFENDGEHNYFVRRSFTGGSIQNTRIRQDSWNIDKLDGEGTSKETLDITKAQIFFIDIEWLGVGSVRCGFVIGGRLIHCHSFHHANILSTTYMTTACLPIRYEIENIGVTSISSTLRQICSTVITEGGYELSGSAHTYGIEPVDASQKTLTTAGTYYPVLSFKLHPDRLDAIVVPTDIDIVPINNGVYRIKIVRNGTFVGDTWANTYSTSAVQYQSNTLATHSGGEEIFSGYLTATTQARTSFNFGRELFNYQLERNGLTDNALEFTLLITSDTNSSNVVASMTWQEIT